MALDSGYSTKSYIHKSICNNCGCKHETKEDNIKYRIRYGNGPYTYEYSNNGYEKVHDWQSYFYVNCPECNHFEKIKLYPIVGKRIKEEYLNNCNTKIKCSKCRCEDFKNLSELIFLKNKKKYYFQCSNCEKCQIFSHNNLFNLESIPESTIVIDDDSKCVIS